MTTGIVGIAFFAARAAGVDKSSDNPVGSSKNIRWNCQPNLLGGLQIDNKLKLFRLLDGQVGGLRSFQDLIDISRSSS
jgi:hypothetical protein